MKKLIVGAVALAVAALGFGGLAAPTTQAAVDDTVVVNCTFLATTAAPCAGGVTDAEITALEAAVGDGDGILEAAELADLADISAAQVGAAPSTTSFALFILVDDDEQIDVTVPTDLQLDGGGDVSCTLDPDCDNDNTLGNGAIAVVVTASGTASVGDTPTINIDQAGSTASVDALVVGEPDEISIVETEEIVQAGDGDCGDTSAATDGDDVDKLVMAGFVVDNAGNELVAVPVDWSIDDDDLASIDGTDDDAGADTDDVEADVYTVNSDVGIASFAVLCGEAPGEVTVTAAIDAATLGFGQAETAEAVKTVVGEPAAIALTAAPAAIPCDGVSSSTVTAVVTDADGNPVVAGTNVTFSVVALGTANPVNAETDDTGTATSVITPLSAADAGVVVSVSSGDADAQIRIDCLASLATPTAPAPTATPVGGITGPDTGSGGYLGQDSSAGFPLWTLAALALGGIALTAGTAVVRRVSR